MENSVGSGAKIAVVKNIKKIAFLLFSTKISLSSAPLRVRSATTTRNVKTSPIAIIPKKTKP